MPTRGSAGSTACSSTGSWGEPPRLLDRARGLPARVPLRALHAAAAPRAHPGRRPGDPRLQPPLVPRPVPHRAASCAGRSTSSPRRELFAIRPIAWILGRARRVPDRARRGRRRGDGDGAGDPRARRRRGDLPRGHARAPGPARRPAARRRPPGAAERRAGRADRRHRHRGRPPRRDLPPAPGDAELRRAAALPARRRSVAAARRCDHGPHLAERRARVGRRSAGSRACWPRRPARTSFRPA